MARGCREQHRQRGNYAGIAGTGEWGGSINNAGWARGAYRLERFPNHIVTRMAKPVLMTTVARRLLSSGEACLYVVIDAYRKGDVRYTVRSLNAR